MWLIAQYEPAALFSLKVGMATATGAKTLLIPTPFAVRTALLDVAIRVEGVAYGPQAFDLIRTLDLALRPPRYAAVTNLFGRILKPARADKARGQAMQSTIAFREYVHLQGGIGLAFQGEERALQQVARWLPHLTYLGRRGGFVQFLPPYTYQPVENLPTGFVSLTQPAENFPDLSRGKFPLGLIQMLDEWGPELTYAKVNVFDPARIRRPGSGKDRVRYGIILPLQLTRAGRGFSLFERVDV